MSLAVRCAGCGETFDTGLGSSEDRCHHCRTVARRLADGGRDLSNAERAAMHAFFGGVVPVDEVPMVVTEAVGALAIGDGRVVDVATLEGRRAVPIDQQTITTDPKD